MTDLLSSDPNAEPSPPPAVIAPAADPAVQPFKITGAMVPSGQGPVYVSSAPKVSLIPPDATPDVAPSAGSVVGAAFRQSNPLVSALSNQEIPGGAWWMDPADPNWNPIKDIEGTQYAPYADRFVGVFNRQQSVALKAQIDMEEQDRRTLDAAGGWGALASIGAGTLDPTMLLPVGEFYKGAKLGLGAAKGAVRVGAGFAAATATSEAALQSSQETRPVSQSLFTIGGAAVLGGLLGGLASPIGRAIGPAVKTRLAAGLSRITNKDVPDVLAENASREALLFDKADKGTLTPQDLQEFETEIKANSAGAAAVEGPSLVDEEIYGNAARGAAEQTRWASTNLRLATSESANTRALDMLDFGVYKKKNFADLPEDVRKTSQDIENAAKLTEGQLYQAERNHYIEYGKYRLGGGTLPLADFNVEVGKAMEDLKHDIPEVMASADGYNGKLYHPTKESAIEVGGLPEDVKVTEAEGYFNINYDQKKFVAGEPGYKADVLTPHFTGVVQNRIEELAARRDEAIARIDAEIADFEASPEVTQKLLADLPEQAKALEKANPQHQATDMALQQLRAKAADALAAAKAAPGTSTAALKGQEAVAHTVEVKRIIKEAGEDYAAYRSARGALASRQTRLRGNLVSLAGKEDAARGQLADIEHANIQRYKALFAGLTNLKAEMERAPRLESIGETQSNVYHANSDPDIIGRVDPRVPNDTAGNPDTYAEMVTKYELDLYQALERSDAALDRLAAASEKAAEGGTIEEGMPDAFGGSPYATPGRKGPRTAADAHFDGVKKTGPPTEPTSFAGILKDARQPPLEPPKYDKFPASSRLKKAGGVAPNSALAKELRAAGVNADSAKKAGIIGLFRDGGLKTADNLDPGGDVLFAEAARQRKDGYIPQDFLIQAVKDEMNGNPLLEEHIAEQLKGIERHEANTEHYRDELRKMGVDLDTMTDDQVMARLSTLQDEHNTLYNDPTPPAKSEHDYGAEAPPIVTKSEEDIRAAQNARQRIFDAVDREHMKTVWKRTEQLQLLSTLDPKERAAELLQLFEERIQKTAGTIGRADDHMGAISGRLKKNNPKVAEAKIADLRKSRAAADKAYGDAVDIGMHGADDTTVSKGAPGEVRLSPQQDYVQSIVNHVADQLAGRTNLGGPFRLDPVLTGPMAARTLHIPQHLTRDFREMDVVKNSRRYARQMGPAIAVLRRYKTLDMRDQLGEIAKDWDKIRAAVPDGPGAEARRLEIDRNQKAEYNHITSRRDRILGVNQPDDNTPFARFLDGAGALAYAAHFGGMLASALGDPARLMMHEGLGHFLNHGLAPLIRNLKAVTMSAEDGKQMGAILERVRSGRLANVSALTDPLARHGPVVAITKFLAEVTTKLSGITWWDDWMKTIAHTMATHKMIEGVNNYAGTTIEHRAWMAMMGIDQEGAARIATQFAKHGETIDGIHIAHWEDWGKGEVAGTSQQAQAAVAKREYGVGLNKAVSGPTPSSFSMGDKPLVASTPLGRAAFLGQSFMLASHTRMTIRGLQEGPANFISAMIAGTTAGMFIYWLKAVENNTVNKLSDNPGHWLMEGIDRSGMIPLFFTVNNLMERQLGVGAYGAGQMLFPGKSQNVNMSRAGVAAAALGPSGDYIDGMQKAIQGLSSIASGRPATVATARGLRSLLPVSTVPFVRSILDYGIMPFASGHLAKTSTTGAGKLPVAGALPQAAKAAPRAGAIP